MKRTEGGRTKRRRLHRGKDTIRFQRKQKERQQKEHEKLQTYLDTLTDKVH